MVPAARHRSSPASSAALPSGSARRGPGRRAWRRGPARTRRPPRASRGARAGGSGCARRAPRRPGGGRGRRGAARPSSRRARAYADPPDGPDGGDDAEAVARRLTLAAALARLGSRQRAVIVLRYHQGLDVLETAAALGCSEGTVKSQTARGLAALREQLTEPALGGSAA
ncbi:sigma-70 family RNA polymerase sigma factor [Dactylosporangium sp. CA-139066]|uniref:sigma-70 family RNA polymerase sigma factor n=1 Tax=Dactylosporangium sp. CA-139066 TaxID=3239930 RepID=UPI003D931023